VRLVHDDDHAARLLADAVEAVLGAVYVDAGYGVAHAVAVASGTDALHLALRAAGIGPGEIDYVNTHGTSTPLGDVTEVRAMRRFFGGRAVRYSSTKGYTGHTVTAAGAIEAVFAMAMLRGGWVAPSANAQPLDPELEDYPPVLAPVNAALRYALSNSFGFGGTNASLVLARE
jgi:3-oxoacyl-[acyl-carrier-protein] synthase-1